MDKTVDNSTSGLFSKVSLLLSVTFVISALGTAAGAGITSLGAIIALAILFLAGAFAVPFAAKKSTAAGIGALAIWTFISGLFLGPCINSYAHILGWQTVFLAYLGTGGVMAACGAIGILSGINFSSLGRWLMFALLGLIAVGIRRHIHSLQPGMNIVYSLIGMAVFALFFIYNFFQAKDAENTWESAVMVTMQSYLNFINFLLYLLQFLAAIAGGGKSKD